MLPELGFHIGMRAIKVDDRTAWRIIENWPALMRQWRAKHGTPEVAKVEEGPKVKKEVMLPAVLTVRYGRAYEKWHSCGNERAH